jgi:hypothetical protein
MIDYDKVPERVWIDLCALSAKFTAEYLAKKEKEEQQDRLDRQDCR